MLKFFLGLAVGLVIGAGGAFGTRFIGTFAAKARAQAVAMQQQVQQPTHNSGRATLQTLRGQTELFKIQHGDNPPAPGALALVLSGKTNARDVATTSNTGTLGPYVQQFPTNPENGKSAVGAAPSANVGWVYTVTGNEYRIQAVNAAGTDVMPY